jgi:hypothetical protein
MRSNTDLQWLCLLAGTGLKSWSDIQQHYDKEQKATDLTSLYKNSLLHVIDPSKSWKLRYWDVFMLAVILYVAFAEPYQVMNRGNHAPALLAWLQLGHPACHEPCKAHPEH